MFVHFLFKQKKNLNMSNLCKTYVLLDYINNYQLFFDIIN